jgi:hypothetical protein
MEGLIGWMNARLFRFGAWIVKAVLRQIGIIRGADDWVKLAKRSGAAQSDGA